MKEAVEDDVDLMRYTMWGCTNLVSASNGEMKKRYGFVYADKDNDGNGDLHRERKKIASTGFRKSSFPMARTSTDHANENNCRSSNRLPQLFFFTHRY